MDARLDKDELIKSLSFADDPYVKAGFNIRAKYAMI